MRDPEPMNEKNPPSASAPRRQKEAQALRANLALRKGQSRARSEAGDPTTLIEEKDRTR